MPNETTATDLHAEGWDLQPGQVWDMSPARLGILFLAVESSALGFWTASHSHWTVGVLACTLAFGSFLTRGFSMLTGLVVSSFWAFSMWHLGGSLPASFLISGAVFAVSMALHLQVLGVFGSSEENAPSHGNIIDSVPKPASTANARYEFPGFLRLVPNPKAGFDLVDPETDIHIQVIDAPATGRYDEAECQRSETAELARLEKFGWTQCESRGRYLLQDDAEKQVLRFDSSACDQDGRRHVRQKFFVSHNGTHIQIAGYIPADVHEEFPALVEILATSACGQVAAPASQTVAMQPAAPAAKPVLAARAA